MLLDIYYSRLGLRYDNFILRCDCTTVKGDYNYTLITLFTFPRIQGFPCLPKRLVLSSFYYAHPFSFTELFGPFENPRLCRITRNCLFRIVLYHDDIRTFKIRFRIKYDILCTWLFSNFYWLYLKEGIWAILGWPS